MNRREFLARISIGPGGDLVHLFSIRDHDCQPHIPATANNRARRIPAPLYGADLIDLV